MRNYFNTNYIDAIEMKDVADLLHYTDTKADKYTRIVMDEEFSFIDIRGDEEVVLQAVVFVEDRLSNFSRYDFKQGDTEYCLYMALDPEKFITVSIGDPEHPVDGIGHFKHHKEAILGLFKTDTATYMIIYKGNADRIEIRHYPDPNVFDVAVKSA